MIRVELRLGATRSTQHGCREAKLSIEDRSARKMKPRTLKALATLGAQPLAAVLPARQGEKAPNRDPVERPLSLSSVVWVRRATKLHEAIGPAPVRRPPYRALR